MQIMIVLMVPHHLTTTNYLSRWYRYAKWVHLCIKKFKISIFDQFFWFWVLECDVYDGYRWDEMRWVYMSSYEMSSHEMSSRGWLSWPVKLLPILSGRWWDPCRLRQVTVLNFSWAQAWECYQSVCLSITQKLQRTALRILLIFGQKLDIDTLRKVTKPFFRKKIFWMIQVRKTVFFGGFWSISQKLQ